MRTYLAYGQGNFGLAELIDFDDHRRSHEGLDNVTPADVYDGRRAAILPHRKEQHAATIARRLAYHRSRLLQLTRGESPPQRSVAPALADSQRR